MEYGYANRNQSSFQNNVNSNVGRHQSNAARGCSSNIDNDNINASHEYFNSGNKRIAV